METKENVENKANNGEIGAQKAEVILAGAAIVIDLLKGILDGLNVTRCIAMGINNHLPYSLVSPKFHIHSGKIEGAPLTVNKDEAGLASASKTAGPVATGSVGVLSYLIEGTDYRLAILWSVPFDYNFYENWFKISLVTKDTPTDNALYDDMYYNKGKLTKGKVAKATQGEAIWEPSVKLANKSVKLAGLMGTGGKCTLNLSVKLD